MHRILGRGLLNRSYIHVTSAAEAKALAFIIEPRNIFNLPNFVKLPQRLTRRVNTDSSFKIIFLSRIEEKKGLDILLKALSLVKYPCHLTIAGSGRENYVGQLKSIAVIKGVANKISWIGFQGENKFDLLREHDLLVLPSYDENFGNVVIESLAMGTAVLISKYVGLVDYVSKNSFGWVCDTTIESVSGSINSIIENGRDDLLRIKRDAPATIIEDFNEDKLIHDYINVYKHIIGHE
jgi:glycosyltransferase involved in cell wall biosynthesis